MLWNFWLTFVRNEKTVPFQRESAVFEAISLDEELLSALASWQDRPVPLASPLPRLVATHNGATGLFPQVRLRGTTYSAGRFSAVVDMIGGATGLVVHQGPVAGSELEVLEIGFDFIDMAWQGRRRRFELNDKGASHETLAHSGFNRHNVVCSSSHCWSKKADGPG